MSAPTDRLVAVLLAAGAGRRAGGPKALRRDSDGTSWLVRSIRVLVDGGCDHVVVVLGAGSSAAKEILTEDPPSPAMAGRVRVVDAADWSDGMGASMCVGLETASDFDPIAVLVHLVDLPDVTAAVVDRLRGRAITPAALIRATYEGRPGHPVVFGREHLALVQAELGGDSGARSYLATHQVESVECGDLATGKDRDS